MAYQREAVGSKMMGKATHPTHRRQGEDHPASNFVSNSPPAERTGSALTILRIDKLKATGKTYYVNDAAQPGLSVRVSAAGVKAFVFTKHKDRKFTRITLGRVGAMRLDAARLAAQALHGQLALGVDIAGERRTAKTATKSETMQEAFARFLAKKARRPKTLNDYQSLWRGAIPAGGGR
jgi:hypothetical protein